MMWVNWLTAPYLAIRADSAALRTVPSSVPTTVCVIVTSPTPLVMVCPEEVVPVYLCVCVCVCVCVCARARVCVCNDIKGVDITWLISSVCVALRCAVREPHHPGVFGAAERKGDASNWQDQHWGECALTAACRAALANTRGTETAGCKHPRMCRTPCWRVSTRMRWLQHPDQQSERRGFLEGVRSDVHM
jgi:hypothetical protein